MRATWEWARVTPDNVTAVPPYGGAPGTAMKETMPDGKVFVTCDSMCHFQLWEFSQEGSLERAVTYVSFEGTIKVNRPTDKAVEERRELVA